MNYNHSAAPGKIQFAINNNQINGTTTLAANTWYAVALVREAGGAGVTRLFINGVQEVVAITSVAAINLTTNGAYIGCVPPYGDATLALNGWMDEFRLTKGMARYTGGYTPATMEFPNS